MSFAEEHKRKIRDILILLLTALVLGFLLNLLASVTFQLLLTQLDTFSLILLSLVLIAVSIASAYFAVVILKPPNTFVKVASCNLLWNPRNRRVLPSIYDYSEGYFPQMFAFQMFEKIEQYKPQLKEELKGGIGFPPNEKHILSHLMDYLMLLWLGWDALRPTYRLGFKGKLFRLKDLDKISDKNPMIAIARNLTKNRPGLMPPDITIEIPEDTKISMSETCEETDPNVGKLTLENRYFTVNITYHVSACTPVSSMRMGPAPSMLGMPINPFFLSKDCDKKSRLNLSSVWSMGYYMIFEAKFNELLLLKPRTFYRHMRWVEQLSELFVSFFDWNQNAQKAFASRQGEIHEILKGVELRLEDIEKRLFRSTAGTGDTI